VRVIFFGSPEFAVASLNAVHQHHDLCAVVTQPDRRQGRGKRVKAPPVKERAVDLGIKTILQPEKPRTAAFRKEVTALNADIWIVVAYGHILSKRQLTIPKLGCINVHASLLPRYRGAAPIQWAVINGDSETGVSIMQMDAGMDTGPVWQVVREPICKDDTSGTMHEKLSRIGATALIETLDGLAVDDVASGSRQPTLQGQSGVSAARMLTKQDGAIDFRKNAQVLSCQIRGVDPWPGAYADLGDERIKFFSPVVIIDSYWTLKAADAVPGQILGQEDQGVVIACGDQTAISISELQRSGKKRQLANHVLAGLPDVAVSKFTLSRT